jgi:amino acid transporter
MCACPYTKLQARERKIMVFCTKCGTNNVEGATVCVNCGASLYGAGGVAGHLRYERGYRVHRRGGALAGLIAGLIVIFIGLSLLLQEYDIIIPWWEIIIILLGVYLIWRWFSFRNRQK